MDVSGDVHANNVEGAHHWIGAKSMRNDLNEYTFRWIHRKDETPMFIAFMGQRRSDRVNRNNARITGSGNCA